MSITHPSLQAHHTASPAPLRPYEYSPFEFSRSKPIVLTMVQMCLSGSRFFAFSCLLALSACATHVRPVSPERSADVSVLTDVPVEIQVDHAWVKNADTPAQQDLHLKTMEMLREKIAAGGSFIASWNTLRADGTYWHVAENESYTSDVIPAGARNLAPGSLSPILPGDGGLHLFRILGRAPLK